MIKPGKQGSQDSGSLTNNHIEKHMFINSDQTPVMTYTTETRPDPAETIRMARTNNKKIIRIITGNTLWDQRRSGEIREECKTKNAVR